MADVAGKEYSIEQALDKMQREWEGAEMQVLDYRETKTYVIKVGFVRLLCSPTFERFPLLLPAPACGWTPQSAQCEIECWTFTNEPMPCIMSAQVEDQVSQMLDDHIVMTQSMSFSPYKKPFEERIAKWEATLSLVSEILDQWITLQRWVAERCCCSLLAQGPCATRMRAARNAIRHAARGQHDHGRCLEQLNAER